jgi:hypothetical protein
LCVRACTACTSQNAAQHRPLSPPPCGPTPTEPARLASLHTYTRICRLVAQVLSRDIRSLHKRLGQKTNRQDMYHVILEGVDVSYRVAGENEIVLVDAELGGSGGRAMLAGKQGQQQEGKGGGAGAVGEGDGGGEEKGTGGGGAGDGRAVAVAASEEGGRGVGIGNVGIGRVGIGSVGIGNS